MLVRIEKKPPFRVAGRRIRISGQDSGTSGAFWAESRRNGLVGQLKALADKTERKVTGSDVLGVSCAERDPEDRSFWFSSRRSWGRGIVPPGLSLTRFRKGPGRSFGTAGNCRELWRTRSGTLCWNGSRPRRIAEPLRRNWRHTRRTALRTLNSGCPLCRSVRKKNRSPSGKCAGKGSFCLRKKPRPSSGVGRRGFWRCPGTAGTLTPCR